MVDLITDQDCHVLEFIAKHYERRNIIGQSRQITDGKEADVYIAVLRRVAARIRELGSQYPNGVPTPSP